MEPKARENLDAARALLDEENAKEPCPNAAASRAYYAAYQACWTRLGEQGLPPPEVRPDKFYWPHEDLPDLMEENGLLPRDSAMDLVFLLGKRVTADYQLDQVVVEEAQLAIDTAEQLLAQLLGDEDDL